MEVLFKRVYEKVTTQHYREYNELIDSTEKMENKDPFQIIIEEYSDDYHGIKNATEKHPYFKFSRLTNDQDDFKNNYGNPLCDTFISRLTYVVEKDENKVSMKLFFYSKHRKVGTTYFRKSSKMSFITYSFSTNDMYSGHIFNAFKKRKFSKKLRKNYFSSYPFKNMVTNFVNNFKSHIDKENCTENSYELVKEAVSKFLSYIPNFPKDYKYEYDVDVKFNVDELMFKQYMDIRGIKYPNNYNIFLQFLLPKKRIIKNCKNKLVESIMMTNDLRGDKIKRILHNSEFINFEFYKRIRSFFGENFMSQIDDSSLHTILNFKGGYSIPDRDYGFSKTELNNVFSIMLQKLSSDMYSFLDHLRFYTIIKRYENIKWKSYNISTFNKEHSEWTNKYDHYTKGKYSRIYGKRFSEMVTQEIKSENGVYYPVLLKTTEEYNMESSVQSNCVKTYVDRASAMIISLRQGSIDSQERATIEYQIGLGFKDQLVFRRRQSLGRFNNMLDKSWETILSKLDGNLELAKNYFELPKVIVEHGGGVIESDSHFGEDGKSNFDWVSPYLKQIKSDFLL